MSDAMTRRKGEIGDLRRNWTHYREHAAEKSGRAS
jgi:hypothetical protein